MARGCTTGGSRRGMPPAKCPASAGCGASASRIDSRGGSEEVAVPLGVVEMSAEILLGVVAERHEDEAEAVRFRAALEAELRDPLPPPAGAAGDPGLDPLRLGVLGSREHAGEEPPHRRRMAGIEEGVPPD